MKRCICGLSDRFPLCDYAHQREAWSCQQREQNYVDDLFMAPAHLVNYAEKLAYHYGGSSLHTVQGQVYAKRLVIISDGVAINELRRLLRRVEVEEILLLSLGVDGGLFTHAFPGAEVREVKGESLADTWAGLVRAIESEQGALIEKISPRLFFSHAIADEPLLLPVVDQLRNSYGLQIFFCADSIRQGHRWREEIFSELRSCELFFFFASDAASNSLFCSFELGMAVGLAKKMHVVSLAEGAIPAPISDLQALELGRHHVRKPWLTKQQALLDAILMQLSVVHHESA